MEPVSTDHVTAFRRFNRYFTRRIGVLDDHYLGQDRPLGEARLLFEIGDGMSLRELRSRLGLDAGYLSRMAKALQAQGMVTLSAHPEDSRLRMIAPTPAGRVEVKEQNRRANLVAAGLLDGLSEPQRAELAGALATAQRLLRLASITVVLVDGAAPDARACLDGYAADIDERFPEGFDKDDLVAPQEVSGDAGAFFVAYEEDRPVGCGALRRLEPGVGEIRHVWVHPSARRLGLARRLLDALEQEAVARHLNVVRLDTHAALTEAQAMYRACGYTAIPAYDDNVYASHWFEKRLAP
ncbi:MULTISPECIES: bifunctional helix-turn-helix transcriptional regulator/GNAT family N-acetyltransferase [unclassified Streptomyces]|uniref:bifunctional helix-turn-helix transcriptional regulator/GNAT family N-acetyltransferase n=1 Tax=Streptomyces TaxID=1883 RepID=UPI0004C84A2E|nr:MULTISPECIES: bifunctional helix-turn-helix transcriptional regulator/GNAT family N-acetyltransferase [unclassified Streptomyces]SEC57374.1 transcriptional regulator, MarR family with acetyltransferase activity [Streptomyces sp. KS_5]SED05785.1 transcriptional regulator, MarR family with acetyltransferase activity [Streptomyces sp. PAN_FS17]